MTKYVYEHTVRTTARPDAVWRLWADAPNWPAWDTSVTSVELTGLFAEGTTGTMHLADQPPVGIRLVEVTPGVGFVDETEIPGALLRFDHRVTATADGSRVTHRVEIEGGAEFVGRLGPAVTADVPAAMAGLVALAEREVAADRASSTA
jgi:Polyketide cyclase / dehydrase and lipid transport